MARVEAGRKFGRLRLCILASTGGVAQRHNGTTRSAGDQLERRLGLGEGVSYQVLGRGAWRASSSSNSVQRPVCKPAFCFGSVMQGPRGLGVLQPSGALSGRVNSETVVKAADDRRTPRRCRAFRPLHGATLFGARIAFGVRMMKNRSAPPQNSTFATNCRRCSGGLRWRRTTTSSRVNFSGSGMRWRDFFCP